MRTNKIGRIGEGKAEHFILSLFTVHQLERLLKM